MILLRGWTCRNAIRGDFMNVLLKPEIEKFVTEKVQAGQYANPSDIVNQALEVLRDQEEFTPEHEAYLRREVRRGLEQLDRGEFASFDAEKIIAADRRKA
jgi:antitoxin ParD1/3/4